MVASIIDLDNVRSASLLGRQFLPASWEKAAELANRLRECGIAATACFEMATHSAGLEVPVETDLQAVALILDQVPDDADSPTFVAHP